MTDNLRDRLAESITDAIETILDQHEFTTQSGQCSCGLRNNMDGDVLDLHRISLIGETVRNTLAIPGIAVVELPEPMTNREEVPQAIRHQSMWEQRYAWATIQGDGLIYFENGSGGSGYGEVDAAEARDLAAALLAAADYAERDQ
jgi:hypothetical protein